MTKSLPTQEDAKYVFGFTRKIIDFERINFFVFVLLHEKKEKKKEEKTKINSLKRTCIRHHIVKLMLNNEEVH
jgi:hypothetical protein